MSHIFRTVGVSAITDVTDASKQLGIDLASATAATTTTFNIAQTTNQTWTLPDATSTWVGTDVTQTLTNKTNYEPTAASVSAAGASQGTATALTNMYNVVTTVAASTGVALPTPTTAGLRITVVNRGANTLNVYPATGGTIDAASANAAVTLPVAGIATYEASSTTQWYTVNPVPVAGTGTIVTYGNGQTTLTANGTISFASITGVGNIQGTAAPLTAQYNSVTGASGQRSVILPTPTVGQIITVYNAASFSTPLLIFPAVGAQIESLAVNASFSIPALTLGTVTFIAVTTTLWHVLYSNLIDNTIVLFGLTAGVTNGVATLVTNDPFSPPGVILDRTGLALSSRIGALSSGTTQGDATVLSAKSYTYISIANSGGGVLLISPSSVAYMMTIYNGGANTVNVYPGVGGQIDAAGTNNPVTIPTSASATYILTSLNNNWNTISFPIAAGSGMSVSYGSGQATITNAGVTTLAGTSNQITASASTGAVTLSTPSTFIAPGTIASTTSLTAGTLLYTGTSATVSAAGSNQAGATALTNTYNVVTTVASNTGVSLPTPATAGLIIIVVNKGANTLNVYPATGGAIDGAATNAAVTILVNGVAAYQAATTTQWYSIDPSLVAGTGITVTYGNGQTTIANGGVTTFSAGTTGFTPNSATAGAITLAGTLIPANGGTGVTTTPTNGQLLIGNGTNYTVASLGSGTGISTTTGAGTLTVNNTGVTSITGTTNQITASASTGSVTLSVPEPASAITSASSGISNSETYVSASFPIGAATIAAGDSFFICVYATATVTTTAPTATFNVRFGTAGTTSDTALLSPTYTTAVGSAIAFNWVAYVTFRSTTSAIASCTLTNTGTTGISTTQSVVTIGSVVSSLTTSAAFLGLSYVSGSNKCTVTFQQITVNRIR